jgi:hypothetical protein
MYLLFPGRHHLLTDFQFKYLFRLIKCGLSGEKDVSGIPLNIDNPVEAIIVPVTSANHANTRRNPVPFYLRAMAIEKFCDMLQVPSFIYGIDDVGNLRDFASYTIKRIAHQSENRLVLTPKNTVVLCSTPVLTMYEKTGFRILPVELTDRATWTHSPDVPWTIIERVAQCPGDWRGNKDVISQIHPASFELWSRYNLGDKVRMLFSDPMLGEDGDITKTRDYNTYVRQMDEIAEQKFSDTARYIRPGRIGDIGCAVGSWLKFVADDERFRESDLFGIEVVRHLFTICEQRKQNLEFANPFVFFSQKNALTGLVFDKDSMDTIHTSSLTHEIESYGGRNDLMRFIGNRFHELAPGGVWINRDVVGPGSADREVLLWLDRDGRGSAPRLPEEKDRRRLSEKSTHELFLIFAREFRQKEGYTLQFAEETIGSTPYVRCSLRDACEFLSKKDYIDNWASEMHETFCFWDFNEWKAHLEAIGFAIHPESRAFTNPWIVKNRFEKTARIMIRENGRLSQLPWPETHMILIAQKL